jgi:hypothetical protein
MRKNFMIFAGAVVLTCFLSAAVPAQTYNRINKTVTLVSGASKILRGEVRDSDEIAYRFRARAGQRLTVKITGKDVDFTVSAIYKYGPQTIVEDKRSWTGKLPVTFYKKYEIVVHSNYKVADYRLEVLLK